MRRPSSPLAGPPYVVFYDVIGLHESAGSDLDTLVAGAASTVVAVTRSLRPDLGAAALARGAYAAIPIDGSGADFLESSTPPCREPERVCRVPGGHG